MRTSFESLVRPKYGAKIGSDSSPHSNAIFIEMTQINIDFESVSTENGIYDINNMLILMSNGSYFR